MAALLLLLVVVLHSGAFGLMLANALAWASVLPHSIAVLRRHWSSNVTGRDVAAALAFGLPLMPHALAHWGLNVSDRLLLGLWVSEASIGIYSVGYQAAAVLGVLLIATNWAIMPHYGRLARRQAALPGETRGLIVGQVCFTLLLSSVWAFVTPAAVRLLLPDAYSSAAAIVPWVVLGQCLFGLYLIPMNVLSIVIGQTRWAWTATASAVAVNVGSNLYLIPHYGIEGAAMATALGYAALLATMSAYALRSYFPATLPAGVLNHA